MNLSAYKPFALLALIALVAFPGRGQSSVSADQMEQQLDALAQHKDGASSAQLLHFQLTERVSPPRLERWKSKCKGQLAWQTLVYLTDASSVYDLPSAEIPASSPPGEAARADMLDKAQQYIHTVRSRLPDFLATRTVTTFQNATLDQMQAEEAQAQFMAMTTDRLGFRSLGAARPPGQLFLEGSAESVVTYRGGSEVHTPAPRKQGKHHAPAPQVLSSFGEFGSVLALVDPAFGNRSIAWHHWEKGPSGLLAAFRFSVPAAASHFALTSSLGNLPGVSSVDHPAYHGEISIDPATGSVFRIAIVAERSNPDVAAGVGPLAAMVVEYGDIDIGGKDYVCPLHAIAIFEVTDTDLRGASDPSRTVLNDVTFSDYHLFRSEMRILP